MIWSECRRLFEETLPKDVDLSSFELKDSLNRDFWKDGMMDKVARRQLLDISKDFLENLELENVAVEDIVVTGSVANYNWSKRYSDIDLHIIVNYAEYFDSSAVAQQYFDSIRKYWNLTHDRIKIYGFPVEIYVQDITEPHDFPGTYSIITNEWITKPEKKYLENKGLNKETVKSAVSELMNRIDDAEKLLNHAETRADFVEAYNLAKEIFKDIKDTRKESFKDNDEHQEMTEGNLTFKTLRRNGYIEKIVGIKNDAYDMMKSVR